MKENLVVSDRGQITLPSAMRKSPGLGKSAVITAERIGGRIVLTPAVVLETELYTDEQVREEAACTGSSWMPMSCSQPRTIMKGRPRT